MALQLHGKTFGRLTAIEPVGTVSGQGFRWRCLCACGKEKLAFAKDLNAGVAISCGCARRRENRTTKSPCATHEGERKHPVEYRAWKAMKMRCTRKAGKFYDRYGGRGISVCERWSRFENFYADMGPRPLGTSLDRIDNNGGYSPDNCRWATRIEQASNKSSNRALSAFGKTATLAQFARDHQIKEETLRARLDRWGMTPEQALTAPLQMHPGVTLERARRELAKEQK